MRIYFNLKNTVAWKVLELLYCYLFYFIIFGVMSAFYALIVCLFFQFSLDEKKMSTKQILTVQ